MKTILIRAIIIESNTKNFENHRASSIIQSLDRNLRLSNIKSIPTQQHFQPGQLAQQAKLIAAQVAQAESAAELNQASAMKARAEAWQTSNYAGPEAEARTSSARSVVDLNERRGQEINAAIRFIDEQIKTEGTKRVLNMSDAALNDAKQALVDLEAKHSQLG